MSSVPRTGPPPGLVLLICTAVWGSTFWVTKDLVAGAPPLGYLMVRFGIAAIVIAPVVWWRRDRLRSPQLFGDVMVIGLLNAVGLGFQVVGQVYTTASKSAFITSLNTPLTALVGLIVYGIVPTVAQRVAVALASVGLLMLTWPGAGGHVNPGDVITLGCATMYGFFITESARRAPRHDAAILAAGQVVIAAVVFSLAVGACALCTRLVPEASWPALVRLEQRHIFVTPRLVAQMGYMSIVCVVVIMLAQTWALQRLTATTAAVIFATEPVFAMAIAVAIDGASEWPGPRGAAGGMMVLLAVYVAEGRSRRRAMSAASANSPHTAVSGEDPEPRVTSQPEDFGPQK